MDIHQKDVCSSSDEDPTKENRLLLPSNPFYIFVLFNHLAVLLIESYQKISKERKHYCSMYPSCSEFSRLAYKKYDVLYATKRTFERLLACADIIEGWPIENRP